jgi:hypothetical protein
MSGLTTFIFIIAAGFWGAFLLILLGWASSTLWTFGVNVVREMRKPTPEPVSKNVGSITRPRPRIVGTTALETALHLGSEWPPENWEDALLAFIERYPSYETGKNALYLLSDERTSFFRYEPARIACECMDYTSTGGLAGPCQCGHSIQDHAAGICTIVTTVRTGNQRAVEQYINRRTRVSQ